ncbi:hypothetical protein F5Y15DRAFT_147572 [Xylariaceae sp. FL0016]|nr:hypothetical protein F5Y15DRAFT_147572 [Xylariaceae sp. FL0016]
MGDPGLNYFTCTLGQAALSKKQAGQSSESFKSVIDLIETQAELVPDAPALGFAFTSKKERHTHKRGRSLLIDDDGIVAIPDQLSFSELNDLSKIAATILKEALPISQNDESSRSIGLVCCSSLSFVLTWLGLMRLGYKTFLLAPQLDIPSLVHLCRNSLVATILADEEQQAKLTGLGDGIKFVEIPAYHTRSNLKESIQDCGEPGIETSEVAYLRHTSGTSSGLPKPIVQTQWGAVGCLPVFSAHDQPATFSTTPLYHGGLADCFRAWTSGAAVWFFPEGAMPITGSNIMRSVTCARYRSRAPIKYFSSVPYVLQMLAQEEEGIKFLQDMDLVGVGGAALPASVGDNLVKLDVSLVSRMGSAECGFLMSSHRDYREDKEWQYLRPIEDAAFLTFEARDNGLSELVVRPQWPLRAKTNRADGSYATSDLFEPHPSIPNAWRYHSRADAQITLANGKKFDPSPLEGAIRASTDVLQDVLIFGAGRDYAGALLFKSSKSDAGRDVLNTVWPIVQSMNHESSSHARLTKPMLVVLDAEDDVAPLPKSSKGTILRVQAQERYAEVIERAYSIANASPDGNQVVSDDKLLAKVTAIFSEIDGKEVDPDRDLYEQGIDSIACIQIRKMIEATCLPPESPPLPMDIIYDSGTIQILVHQLSCIRQGKSIVKPKDGDSELHLMRLLAEKYSNFDDIPIRALKDGDNVVVLTGATGILGSHILAQLSSDARVSKVYCLLRGQTPFAARERVAKALLMRKLVTMQELREHRVPHPKVECIPCDLGSPQLGLSDEGWELLKKEATVFIHSAWTVNFSLRLSSFESHIVGLRNMVNAALSSGSQFHFISSTAAVRSSSSKTVPEKPSTDPRDASSLGYSRSKWIAESVCAAAYEYANDRSQSQRVRAARISVLRVGQLCGNKAGVWNASEAYPLMLSTANVIKCLPDLPNEPLSWLPADIAAKSVLEIALRRSESTKAVKAPALGSMAPFYHVVNPHKTPSWQTMLEWIKGMCGNSPIDAVAPADWVQRLQTVFDTTKTKHPSQALLGMWKKRYAPGPLEERTNNGTRMVKAPPVFEVTITEQVSPAIRDLQPLDRDAVEKMWNWIQQNC